MKKTIVEKPNQWIVEEDGIVFGYERSNYIDHWWHEIGGVRFYAKTKEEIAKVKKGLMQ